MKTCILSLACLFIFAGPMSLSAEDTNSIQADKAKQPKIRAEINRYLKNRGALLSASAALKNANAQSVVFCGGGLLANPGACRAASAVRARSERTIARINALWVRADFNHDALIDQADIDLMSVCYFGSSGPAEGDCQAFDLSFDSLVNLSDLAILAVYKNIHDLTAP